jgi:hypothetical protein
MYKVCMSKTLLTVKVAYESAKQRYGGAYPSRKWPRTYTIAQLVGIGVLKQVLNNMDYRELEDILEWWKEMRDVLEIDRVIHYSNLNRWLRKLDEEMLQQVNWELVECYDEESCGIVADDTTGLKLGNCSSYFAKRTGRKQKRFWKLGVSVDINSKFIYGFVTGYWPSSDIRYWERLNEVTEGKVGIRLKDKWFDGWDNVKDITDVICRWWNIVAEERRERDCEVWLLKEVWVFWYRWMVETVYSVIKRKFWEMVRDTLDEAKKLTMCFKALAYNARLS